MAGRIKQTDAQEEKVTVINFDNNKDYTAIKLLSNGKIYVEHKLLAEKLVKAKKAEYAKDVKLEEVKPNTTVLD